MRFLDPRNKQYFFSSFSSLQSISSETFMTIDKSTFSLKFIIFKDSLNQFESIVLFFIELYKCFDRISNIYRNDIELYSKFKCCHVYGIIKNNICWI